jgi:hypothetical protein
VAGAVCPRGQRAWNRGAALEPWNVDPEAARETGLGRGAPDWLVGLQALRPSTRLAYEIHLRRYLISHLEHLPLAQLTLTDIDAIYAAIATLMRFRLACGPPGTVQDLPAGDGRPRLPG